ncbi:hypothetical protein NDU88_002446 [Pleurodeles waltl]|uniref:Uncharacterized protein n=1 Tax=Pleurodeles waltl TaxID=8319 RepID=A0AAV7TKR3_PLEWA|nr:hypothetical protein NDU88_002446 [Pleurodeles waltl]
MQRSVLLLCGTMSSSAKFVGPKSKVRAAPVRLGHAAESLGARAPHRRLCPARATPGASGPDRGHLGPRTAPCEDRPAGRCFPLGGQPVRPSRSGPGSPQSSATGAEGVGSDQLNQEGSAQPPRAPSGIRAAAAAADAPRTTGGALLSSPPPARPLFGAGSLAPPSRSAPHPASGTPPIQGVHVLGFP